MTSPAWGARMQPDVVDNTHRLVSQVRRRCHGNRAGKESARSNRAYHLDGVHQGYIGGMLGQLCPARADTAPCCQSLRHRKEAVEALHGQTSGAFAVLEYRSEASTRGQELGGHSAERG